jgi:hypothetical protein
MKKNLFGFTTVIALVLLLVSGCAKAPQVELDAAKASMEAAGSVEANRYLAEEYNSLQDSLNAVTVAIEAENSKSFMSRDYDAITEKIVKITTDSDALKLKVEERKVQVRDEVQNSLVELTTLITEDKELLTKAPKGKEGMTALEAIQSDITIIEASVNEINTLISNGDYLTAQDKVNASKAKAEAIKEELTTAISKVGRG